jgi:hypothetical protein
MEQSVVTANDFIWSSAWSDTNDQVPTFVYFRKQIIVNEIPKQWNIRISADNRYKLYINQHFVTEGPIKGDKQTWYYDTINISPFMRVGVNVISVVVLRYPTELNLRNHSLFRTKYPFLYVSDDYKQISSSFGWKCKIASDITLTKEKFIPAPLHINENATTSQQFFGWQSIAFNDQGWDEPCSYEEGDFNKAISPYNLLPSNIPNQQHSDHNFEDVYHIRRPQNDIEVYRGWSGLIEKDVPTVIPANVKQIVELDAGELMTGYLKFAFEGGTKAEITITCAESYGQKNPAELLPVKGDRTDCQNGTIFGNEDHYYVGGYGSRELAEVYETFWFRTFRYVKLEIRTGEEPLKLKQLSYISTGYPLDVKMQVRTDNSELNSIWDISLRTLKRCMHETYMDCPYYEQLQYTMDSRSEILFTYNISGDDRLARRCIDDFARTQRYDGMLQASAPSIRPNIIPGFSIYYIMMIYDHMMYFGDKKLVQQYYPVIEKILNFFRTHINDMGLVENLGGLHKDNKYWSFIDWTPEWQQTEGVPTAIKDGPLTMESLLFIYGLQHAQKIAHFLNKISDEREFIELSESVKEAVNKYCYRDGLYRDGPTNNNVCVHTQVFAILGDVVTNVKSAQKLLYDTVSNSAYPQCSVSMSYYLFRAFEKVGIYNETSKLWAPWRKMLHDNLTTCVENYTDQRSDCHAWGSIALYELPIVMLGIHPTAPGFKSARINPIFVDCSYARGGLMTHFGPIICDFRLSNGQVLGEVSIPKEINEVNIDSENIIRKT